MGRLTVVLLILQSIALADRAPAAAPAAAPSPGRDDGPAWIGYRGPRATGVFPDSRPPADCDMKTGRNVLWRTPLPNWCNGVPIVVSDRAFVLSEPGWKHDWPVLTCIDATTGRVLWEREVNHLPATGLSADRQAAVAKQWHDFHALWRDLYRTFNLAVVQKKEAEATARFAQLGGEFGGHRGGGYGQLRSLRPTKDAKMDFRRLQIADAGLRGETWRHGCGLGSDCIGMAFASPVSDGRSVFVTTTFSGAACYDFEGNLRWLKFVPVIRSAEAYARSPLLYRDLLLSDYFGKLVAFDKNTGAVRWMHETQGGSIATPTTITVGGVDIVLSEGKQAGGGSLTATRLPDGQALKIEGWGIGGTQMIVNTDQRDVAFFCGRGQHSFWSEDDAAPKPPVAVRFTLQGQTLKATVLWTGKDFVGAGGYVGMLYHGGRLHCAAGNTAIVIEALTGKVLASSTDRRGGAKRPLPPTTHLLLRAGDRFYGLQARNRTCDGNFDTFATLTCVGAEDSTLGVARLESAEVTPEKLEQIRTQVGWDRWPYPYGCPFTIGGDRLYVRSCDELICIGARP